MSPLKLFVILIAHWCSVHAGRIRIGVISDPNDDVRQNDPKFWAFSNDYSSSVEIVPVITDVQWWDSLQVTKAVCTLFNKGVDGLLSFLPPNLSPILSSYASTYGLPLITKSSARSPMSASLNVELKMIPKTDRTVSDLLQFYKWKSFAFIYDSDYGPQLLQKLLDTSIQAEVESVWRVSNGEQAARYLKLLESNSEYQQEKVIQNVLFATDNGLLDDALVSMPLTFTGKMRFHFISASPMVHLLPRYFPVWHLVTRMCLVDTNGTAYRNMESRWNTLPLRFGESSGSFGNGVPENAILMHDAVGLLSKSYKSFSSQDDVFGRKDTDDNYAVQTQCSENPEKKLITRSNKGVAALENLKQTVWENGVTGNVKFDEDGERTDFRLHIFETASSVTKKVGEWHDYEGLKMLNDKTPTKEKNDDPADKKDTANQKGKTLIVTSFLTTPYLIQKQSASALSGNDRFTGFMKDLMDQISGSLGMRYEIRLVKDGKYGIFDGTKWNGMIGEIIRGEADIAMADLTVTGSREEVVDFTTPFMTMGLNILMKKPAALAEGTSERLAPFGFLSAFTYDTWLVIIAVYVFFGIGFFIVSRYTGAPDRIRSVDTKGSDHLSVCSSFWFAAGSLFLQDTGIYPRSVSHRVLSVIWWVFTLIAVVSYIGSLSSLLIKNRTQIHGAVDNYITSFQLLKNLIETGSPAIGVLTGGSTNAFFKNSEIGLYHDYGNYLTQNPTVMTTSVREGVERVRNSNGSYAFITESTSNEFTSNHEPCDTIVTSGYLDNRAFAMAVQKRSPLRETLNQALLDLLESGTLRQLYEKWWHEEKECSNPSLDILPGLYDNSLSIVEVSGVFYILVIGVVVAFLTALIEYFMRSKKLPVDK